ncbi:nuclear transport factor 2 family protein [Streptomyces sp. NPDC058221]|uniref:nuclear transport factor 2 family protein n=1 Tax=Streptomyces sp. NPDC058221 TaxID=3346388 RepID=UPI0036E286B3
MALGIEDRLAVMELVALHGHLVDDGELHRLEELFTDDIVYDVTDLGHGSLVGVDAFRDAALAMGGLDPVGHHVTNIVLTDLGDGRVGSRSKGLGVNADGTCGSVTYEDTVVRGERGWRIAYRKVITRRRPLSAS